MDKLFTKGQKVKCNYTGNKGEIVEYLCDTQDLPPSQRDQVVVRFYATCRGSRAYNSQRSQFNLKAI